MNTPILDSREAIAQLDKENMLGSIEELGLQVQHAWEDLKSVHFTKKADIHNVVIAGMGGSGLGADVIKHLFKEELQVPFDYVHDYTLPGYVNQNTLVVLSSYSGTTEEPLACGEQAKEAGAQIMVIAAGGTLETFAKENGYTMYKIDPKYNPSNQPRMAIGYAVFGTIGLLSRAGVISVSHEQVEAVVKTIQKQVENCKVEVQGEENPAKALAYSMVDRRPIFVVSDFLEGAAHVSTNQGNENAKIFADYQIVPEMNHHLLEGLQYPKSNVTTHIFIFVQSLLYHPKNVIRMQITQKIVEANEIDTLAVPLRSQTKIEQVFEMLTIFGFAGFYLAMLEGINPSPIPFVEDFKVDMKRMTQGL
ncbi:MAG: bifunctional phosphoglucose/phosphomannose isomerase [Patescibacteria group bacterium]|nr:MAG: bifunctional phosphoglucose/phosphomannose isomerase [Patescibacteria group bacterium]